MAIYEEKKGVYVYNRFSATIGIHKDGLVEITIDGVLMQLTKNQFEEIIATRRLFMVGI